MDELRRVGVHHLVTANGILHQCVVELMGDRVINYYTFTDELPMTEWLGGTIELHPAEDGTMTAWYDGHKLESRKQNF